jgi:Arc/MetJ-type ribon-helix-helix transcriptional regulator
MTLLKPEHEAFIQSQIVDGHFAAPDEVIDAAFRFLEMHNAEYARWVQATRAKVKVAQSEMANGEGQDGESVFQGFLAEFRQAQADR